MKQKLTNWNVGGGDKAKRIAIEESKKSKSQKEDKEMKQAVMNSMMDNVNETQNDMIQAQMSNAHGSSLIARPDAPTITDTPPDTSNTTTISPLPVINSELPASDCDDSSAIAKGIDLASTTIPDNTNNASKSQSDDLPEPKPIPTNKISAVK